MTEVLQEVAPSRRPLSVAGLLALTFSAAAAVGAFLPWISVLGESKRGIECDGAIVMVGAGLGFLLALIGVLRRRFGRGMGVGLLLAGLIAGGVGVYDLLSIKDSLGQMGSIANAIVRVEPGLYLCAASGSLMALLGLVVLIVGDRKP